MTKGRQLQTRSPHRAVNLLLIVAGVLLILSAVALNQKNNIAGYILWHKGNTAFNAEDFGQAEIFYAKAIGKAPQNKRLKYNLANAFYAQGRYVEAIASYNEALKATDAKGLPDIWNNLGNAYFMAGDLPRSADAYSKALLMDNNQATRQNFVFVTNKLRDELERKFISRVKKEAEKPANKRTKPDEENVGEKQDGEKDQSPQQANLSSKTVEDLFGQIDRNEDKVMGRISKVKRKIDQPADALDY